MRQNGTYLSCSICVARCKLITIPETIAQDDSTIASRSVWISSFFVLISVVVFLSWISNFFSNRRDDCFSFFFSSVAVCCPFGKNSINFFFFLHSFHGVKLCSMSFTSSDGSHSLVLLLFPLFIFLPFSCVHRTSKFGRLSICVSATNIITGHAVGKCGDLTFCCFFVFGDSDVSSVHALAGSVSSNWSDVCQLQFLLCRIKLTFLLLASVFLLLYSSWEAFFLFVFGTVNLQPPNAGSQTCQAYWHTRGGRLWR